MAFALMDDQIYGHPKFAEAGLEAVGLWALCFSHCAAFLTDGFVKRSVAERFAGVRLEKLAKKLVECGEPGNSGLWDIVEGGWQMHDYLDWNPSREDVLEKREKERLRKEGGRKNQGRDAGGRITSERNPRGQTVEGAAGHTGSHAHAHSNTETDPPPPAPARVIGFGEQQQWSAAWEAANLPGSPMTAHLVAAWNGTPEKQRTTVEKTCLAYKALIDQQRRDGLTPNPSVEHMVRSWGTVIDAARGAIAPVQKKPNNGIASRPIPKVVGDKYVYADEGE